jgi:L-ascorbate metabolism protein UlaG (beta-lactamase superfamily)
LTKPACVTWIGHSTVLIEIDDVQILTDPLLRSRVMHLRRLAALPSDKLAPDAVLLSHVHWDHLDLRSLDLVARETVVVVPKGAGRLVRRRGFTNVVELIEGEQVTIGATSVLATEAEHNVGGRSRMAVSEALGYVVAGSSTIYFAGDTDLFAGMASLAPTIDAALLPVAGWGPRLPPGHLDPLRAANALRMIQPRIAIPIHWGTYAPITTRAPDGAAAAPEEFRRQAATLAPRVDVRVLQVGESTVL